MFKKLSIVSAGILLGAAGALVGVAMAAPANAAVTPSLAASGQSVSASTTGVDGWAQEGPDSNGYVSFVVTVEDTKSDSYHVETTLEIQTSGGSWEPAQVCADFSGTNTEATCDWQAAADDSSPNLQVLGSGTPFRIVVQTKAGNTVKGSVTSGVKDYQNQVNTGKHVVPAYPVPGVAASIGIAWGEANEGPDHYGLDSMNVVSQDPSFDGMHSETTLQIENSGGTWEPAVVCTDFSGAVTESLCDWNVSSTTSGPLQNLSAATEYRVVVQTKSGNTVIDSNTSNFAFYINQT